MGWALSVSFHPSSWSGLCLSWGPPALGGALTLIRAHLYLVPVVGLVVPGPVVSPGAFLAFLVSLVQIQLHPVLNGLSHQGPILGIVIPEFWDSIGIDMIGLVMRVMVES